MEKLEKVKTIEVKRAFVVSQMIRKQKVEKPNNILNDLRLNKRILEKLSLEEFQVRLKNSKKIIKNLKEKELDEILAREYKKRLGAYNNCDWHLGEVDPNETGVWRRMGGLPLEWTNGSLKETAEKIKNAINKNSNRITKRVKYTISNMLKTNVKQLQDEKYLFPIIFQGGTGTRGRKRLKKQMRYDIDDGCMRSIALTISGAEKIKAYIGFPK